MTDMELSVLKNTLESMASDAEDKGQTDFGLRLTVKDAFELSRLEKVVHGTWIASDNTYPRFKCSVCHFRDFRLRHNYCPNCGARMDLEETK